MYFLSTRYVVVIVILIFVKDNNPLKLKGFVNLMWYGQLLMSRNWTPCRKFHIPQQSSFVFIMLILWMYLSLEESVQPVLVMEEAGVSRENCRLCESNCQYLSYTDHLCKTNLIYDHWGKKFKYYFFLKPLNHLKDNCTGLTTGKLSG